MAKSGNFTGSTSNQYITPKTEWNSVPNNDGNYSDVTATLYYKKSSSSTAATSGTLKCSLTINGDKKSTEVSGFNIPTNNTYQKAMSHTVRVPHGSDGSKSVTISCTGYISGTTLESTTCKSTVKLDDIPRASTITVPSASIGEVCKIAIKRASSEFTHTLSYVFGSLKGTIATKTSASSIDWTVPTSFYNEMGSVTSKVGTITCVTYNSGGTEIGRTSSEFTITVSDKNAPILDPSIYVDEDSETYALTGSVRRHIRYFTQPSYEINATAQNGAAIVSQSVSNGDIVYTESSGQMDKPIVTNRFFFTATDSRGYSTTMVSVVTMVEYIKPTSSIKNVAFRSDGTIAFTIEGSCFSGNFGRQVNALTLEYRYKKNNGSYGSWNTVTATLSGNAYSVDVTLSGLDYLSTYTVQARATDKLFAVTSKEYVFSCVPAFDWGKSDFKFNVPVSFPDGNYLKTSSHFNGDADELFTTGLYRTNKCINAPSDNGFLLVFSPVENQVVLQIGCDYEGRNLKYRTYWYNKWYDWKTITIS